MDGVAKTRFWLAMVATLLAGAFGLWLRSIEWHPRAPFDVLGVLWVLSNIPGLVLWGVFAGLLVFALVAWSSYLFGRA